ncbi:alpha-amylase [Merismopedia glauca]|uniref:Alpha-amylase n=1 Tax=Merismopedia glauca CCAP 1448/3 TaxID=1296344 RepID=A0A2T1C204_9CYAN|nr:alpha-amylase [Merismopedia glauca]PSB02291.1 alpha-amylase [Merismopedia glauca CCAP 1448/3]
MTSNNGVMMQYFHWYTPSDGKLWNQAKKKAKELAKVGFTALWLPPAYKGSGGGYDVGYGIYDLFDLGEFDQKGSIRTKYGTRQEYVDAIKALQAVGIEIYADLVFNHKMTGDEIEEAKATPYPRDNRTQPKGDLQDVKTYTHFTFPGRQGKYSSFEWHWWHFNAVDYSDLNQEDDSTIYVFEGKKFDDYVSLEQGNFDYLMGCDLDFDNDWVRGELSHWGKWYLETTGVDGFRLDALKHVPAWYFPQWLDEMRAFTGKELFTVGEYWENNFDVLNWWLDFTNGSVSLFDVPLHYNFHFASQQGGDYDMRQILDGTLMKHRPDLAVTFVANHDSQALQDLESVVEPWFKPLAYAIILLRQEGYPCVFYPDYYGTEYEDWGKDGQEHQIIMPSHRWLIDKFMYARKHYNYGPQYDYFDHFNTIGWTRLGDDEHPKAMAVIMSDGEEGFKSMEVGKPNTKFVDITKHIQEPVMTNESGWGDFRCEAGSVSVWVQED